MLQGPLGSHKLPAVGDVGTFRLVDTRHSWMKGMVVASWGPRVITNKDGRYSMSLTRGDWRLRVIHEQFGELTRIIHVDGDATHDFVMTPPPEKVSSKSR